MSYGRAEEKEKGSKAMREEKTGVVFNVQNYTVNDGPGIRTEFFLKGCTLRCRWCSNPESQTLPRELNVAMKCIGTEICGYCQKACPISGEGVFRLDRGYVVGVDRTLCKRCFRCADMCPSNNLKVWGKEMRVSEVMELLEKERNSFQNSGGGVTFSGGEALVQWEFVQAVLKECRRAGIHSCVESALHVPREWLEAILPYADMMISDIKHMDSEKHRQGTGAGNEQLLENLRRIAQAKMPLILRIPVIPGYNDDPRNLEATADFILKDLDNRILQLQLLRYRRLGEEKYASLGLAYPMGDYKPPERAAFEDRLREIAAYFCSRGIPATPGTTTKIKT